MQLVKLITPKKIKTLRLLFPGRSWFYFLLLFPLFFHRIIHLIPVMGSAILFLLPILIARGMGGISAGYTDCRFYQFQ